MFMENSSSSAELVVDLQIKRDGMAVGFIGKPDDAHELSVLLIGHAFLASGRAVRSNAVTAGVGDAHRYVDEFLGEGIERAWTHDLLGICPHAHQGRRMMRQHLPIVVHPIGLARCHDVIINGSHFRRGLRVLDRRRRSAHGTTAMTRAGKPEPFSTFGNVTKINPPASGTWSKFASSSIW